jgi:hypothetical protein
MVSLKYTQDITQEPYETLMMIMRVGPSVSF